jgi:NAD(P)-dependent dehydrogenase (short-subunit alcohol dehydrogenase family)
MAPEPRTALVTGASKGVGRGIAIGLAEAGWSVGINYFNDREGAEATASSIRDGGGMAWILQADVGDSEQVSGMFDAFMKQAGHLDLLVNNSGVQTWAPLLELKEKDWDRTIRTNLKGTFLCTQRAAQIMKDAGGGVIINIGSGANKAPFPSLVDYCASKGGIETFTGVAAVELGRYGIRVNCVAPGCIEIERTREESPDYEKTWGPLTPLGRTGTVEDVAKAVAFLAGAESEFIAGQTLYVDGGLWSQVPWPYRERDEDD